MKIKMTNLLNILITLAIVYLAILIIDKLMPVIIGGLLALIIWVTIPSILKAIVWVFAGLMNIMTMPVYWVTGYKVILPWWVGLIITIVGIIPMMGLAGIQRKEPTFL